MKSVTTMADALLKTEWQTVPLNDVCLKIQDGAHNSPKEQFSIGGPGRYLYITSKNIRNNFIDLSNVSYVGQDFHDQIYPRCTPEIGDVLLTKDGANTGNVTLNTIAEPFSLLSSVALIKTNAPLLMPEFLAYYLQSPQGLAQITGQMTGTAIKRIILRDLKKADIPLPPRLEQQRIVGLLDEIFEGITRALFNSETALQHTRKMSSSYFDASLNGRESWKLLPIDKCFKVRSGDFLSAKQMDATGSVPVYGGNGVAGHHSSANLDGDNVIIGRVGEKCGNVRNVRGRLWLTDNALYVSEFLQPFDPEFLAIRLEAENLRQTANQTAQPVISYSTIKKIILSFPATISEQKNWLLNL